MVTTRSMSALPSRMPAVSAKRSTSMLACGQARRMLRMSGVVSRTSPSRRKATTRMRGRGGSAIGPLLDMLGGVRRLDEARQALPRPHALAVQQIRELPLVLGQPRAVGFGMPEMQHAGRETAVLAQHAAADQAYEDVGILATPAREGGVETVDLVEVAAPERHVAAARAAPALGTELAQAVEPQIEQRREAIDVAARALGDPVGKTPMLGLEPFDQDALGQLARQQDAVAGDEPAGLGETAMGGHEVAPRDAVAVEKDAIAAGAGTDRAVADLG